MNSSLVTTGPEEFTVGSTELMQSKAFKGGLLWNLVGGSARLLMTDPDGTDYDLAATPQNGGASVGWTVPNVPGTWVRAWKLIDSTGVIQISVPITFRVVLSPGDPF